jgi:D-isomer specific 2-hydroxyacid dehydrogenase, NAD binding domain
MPLRAIKCRLSRATDFPIEWIARQVEPDQQQQVISIHMVLSARTIGLIGATEFALMKPSARLINTSRGPLVVEAALLDALGSRRISGAAIDVFDIEPLPQDHPYRRAENLLATPQFFDFDCDIRPHADFLSGSGLLLQQYCFSAA